MDDPETDIKNTEVSPNQSDTKFDVCPNCNRSSTKNDYISLKNGKTTKTCIKCRTSVKKSLQKIKAKKVPSLNNRQCISELIEILKTKDVELTDEEQVNFLKILDKVK